MWSSRISEPLRPVPILLRLESGSKSKVVMRGHCLIKPYAAVRLQTLPEPKRSGMAARIAEKSKGNFLYAYYVLNDFIKQGTNVGDIDRVDLPNELEDVYRKFIEREMASSTTRWNDVYR